MSPWKLLPLLTFSLAACGDGGGGGDDSDSDTTPGANCETAGTANGCLVKDSEDCTTNNAYDGVAGGWFDDRGGSLFVQLATNDAGMSIGFEIPDASGVASATEFQIPTQVIVHLVDENNPDVVYESCAGNLAITNYTPGDILWGNWGFQAEEVMGVCGLQDYWTSQGEFINVEFCGG